MNEPVQESREVGDRSTSAASIVARLSERGLRIAFAESLTGGLLVAEFVSVPGASRVVSGGVVAYDTSLKHRLLGVSVELLHRVGPVDPGVAAAMANGVRERCAVPVSATSGVPVPADVGVATTGVAGPDPDPQTGQAVGTVYLGMSIGERIETVRLQLTGDRAQIRAQTVDRAVHAIDQLLQEEQNLSRARSHSANTQE